MAVLLVLGARHLLVEAAWFSRFQGPVRLMRAFRTPWISEPRDALSDGGCPAMSAGLFVGAQARSSQLSMIDGLEVLREAISSR